MNLTTLESVRNERLVRIWNELGIDPYGKALQDIESIFKVVSTFALNEKEASPDFLAQKRKAQGRILLLRDNGGLLWLKIRDDTGEVQVAISKKDVLSETVFQLAKLLDLGDIIAVEGIVKRTKTGEITIWASNVVIACKSLAHPPDKVSGLQDVESRYRQRYIDMAFNEGSVIEISDNIATSSGKGFINTIKARSRIISLIRQEFEDRRYVEVETPMLHTLAGGAAARPFQTHLNALNMPLFLRVAPELYLKRLIVGGMSKVFEINRNFRNEGIDSTHNPEFTALEAYAINENASSLMATVETIIRYIARSIRRSPSLVNDYIFEFGEYKIDFSKPFQCVSYASLYKQGTGNDILQETDFVLANKIFEEKCECLIDPNIPTFVYGYPSAISPLTKVIEEQPLLSQRADLFIAGMEIGTIYTEQNDPAVQSKVFNSQVKDLDEATHRNMDNDFIEALKVGMPPTGGLGIGIDRLVMVLTGNTSVKDVIAFPFMKPITKNAFLGET